jgi:hypothetical protein
VTRTDALAAVGALVIFVGLWMIWPAVAIITVGALILSTAVGLALLRHKGDAGPGDKA